MKNLALGTMLALMLTGCATKSTRVASAPCPLAGTDECPLKSTVATASNPCPLAGTDECPLKTSDCCAKTGSK